MYEMFLGPIEQAKRGTQMGLKEYLDLFVSFGIIPQ